METIKRRRPISAGLMALFPPPPHGAQYPNIAELSWRRFQTRLSARKITASKQAHACYSKMCIHAPPTLQKKRNEIPSLIAGISDL